MLGIALAVVFLVVLAAIAAVLVWERLAPRTAHRSAWLAAAAVSGFALVALFDFDQQKAGFQWVPDLGLGFEFTLDAFSALFLVIIGVIGVFVLAFTARYQRGKAGTGRFVATTLAFAASMAGLVLGSDVLTLFIFWEATTFTSYLLIGHQHQSEAARRSARQAALVTGAGGLAMLAGLILLAEEAGSTSIESIVAAAPIGGAAWVLVLIGAMTKSAQFPFSGWLPAAMAAPTPASAFLHSATMVKAGIVLLGRLGPGAGDVGWWVPVVTTVGLVTMLYGAVKALRQVDLKLLLAFGTVSALGLMFAAVGSGVPTLVVAGLAVLVAHALYKSALFLTVGVIEVSEGTRDLRQLGHVGRSRPLVAIAVLAGVASMAAVPLTLGFASKEVALEAYLGESSLSGWLVALLSALTVAYSVRFAASLFADKRAGERPRSDRGLLGPVLVLTLAGIALGLAPGILAGVEGDAAVALVGQASPPKLVIWPGLVPAFGLSLLGLALGLGLGMWSLRRPDPAQGSAQQFDRGIERMQLLAERVTSIIQNGSLPVYLGQILLVAVVVPLPALVRNGALPVPPVGGVIEWVIVVFLVAASLALLRVRRRMSAVLLLGAVGYAMSALFALAGAPDVAITQVLVETLVVTLFALALRVLPLQFSGRLVFVPWKGLVAVLVGAFAVVVALVPGSASPSPVSDTHLALSVPEAAGANVVNVTLVDFRALDTLGEIAVLGIASLGVMALVRPLGQIVGGSAFAVRRSPILDRGAAIVNPLLLVFALYLLLAGHNQPGGGFAAGLVASGWLVIVWLSSGAVGVRRALRVEPSMLIGIGLAVAVVTGLGGLAWADAFLASASWSINGGPLGEIKLVTPLLFDAGVAITVLGSVAGAIRGMEAT